MGKDILSKLKEEGRSGVENSPLTEEQRYLYKLSYKLTYRTSIPKEGLGKHEMNRVALGIFMDFQIRFEFFQGIDPSTLPK